MSNKRHVRDRLFSSNSPQSPVSESFRMLRTNVNLLLNNRSGVVILVTSAGSREGKSIITANLGIVMAQAGRQVLLVDSDLRNPVMHRLFSTDSGIGLTSFLVQGHKFNSVVRDTGIEGLRFISSGPIPYNPSELLGSGQMKNFLEQVKVQYDIVLLDVPPVISVTDTLVLAPQVEGVLLVVKSGVTVIDKVRAAKRQLERAQANIIGVVLNDVKMSRNQQEYSTAIYGKRKQIIKEIGALVPEAAAAKDSS